jgi:adenylate kinase family enzyme
MIAPHHKKIAIIGNAGSGKTALALHLHKKLSLPLYHLDQYYWLPNWQRSCYETFTQKHDELCEQDAWIIEGVNLKVVYRRLVAADVIIFLDLPRRTCIFRALKRCFYGYGTVTPGSPEGCKQRFFKSSFLSLLRWVWNFDNRYRPLLYLFLEDYKLSKPVYILKSEKDVKQFLELFTLNASKIPE